MAKRNCIKRPAERFAVGQLVRLHGPGTPAHGIIGKVVDALHTFTDQHGDVAYGYTVDVPGVPCPTREVEIQGWAVKPRNLRPIDHKQRTVAWADCAWRPNRSRKTLVPRTDHPVSRDEIELLALYRKLTATGREEFKIALRYVLSAKKAGAR